MSCPLLHPDAETTRQVLTRWTAAAACVAALHVGTVYAVTNWPQPPQPAGEPPAAVMVELAPAPVAPEAPPEDLAVGPQKDQREESTPAETQKEPLEETPPTPQAETSKIEPPPEPLPEPAERQVETELPKLPQMERAEAVLPMPAPPPPEPQQEEKKPEEEKKKSEPKEAKSKPKPKSVAQVASAPKPNEAARAKVNAAPFSGTASAASVATWRGTVIAHLNRLKRSAGGNRGTATVAFSIDRSGRVISARLIRSSGNPGLDKEAVALVRRASPVPPPPANIKNNPVLLTAPVAVSR